MSTWFSTLLLSVFHQDGKAISLNMYIFTLRQLIEKRFYHTLNIETHNFDSGGFDFSVTCSMVADVIPNNMLHEIICVSA